MAGGTFTIDGRAVPFADGQTVMDAALEAGVYIPHLCHRPGYAPHGSCKLCTVAIGGRNAAACSTAARDGLVIENESPALVAMRRELVEMLFVEGNHTCPACEKSGECELQAVAHYVGMVAPRFEFFFPARDLDASHPDILLDRNRCILCTRCVRFMEDVVREPVLNVSERGDRAYVGIHPDARLDHSWAGNVVDLCPVGSLLSKDFLHKARAWELDKTPSVCTGCSQGCSVTLDVRDGKRTVSVEERQVGRTRFEKLDLDAAAIASQPALIDELLTRADPDLVLDARLTGVRRDELDIATDEVEAALAPSFLKVRIRDRSVPALTPGPLPPPDTIAGTFIRDLEARIAELEASDRAGDAGELRDALRLGRLLLAGHEVSL